MNDAEYQNIMGFLIFDGVIINAVLTHQIKFTFPRGIAICMQVTLYDI